MDLQKVAIVGATGYSGEELIRLLLRHPGVEIAAVTSRSHAGKTIAEVYPRFQGERNARLAFINSDAKSVIASGATFVFLALPHGLAAEFAKPLLAAGLRVLDLSPDLRIRDAEVYETFYGEKHPAPDLLRQGVYGMPELYREKIRAANLIACPGCYPTSILIPLAPLVKARLLDPREILITSLSGVSGAGRKTEVEYLFPECNESVRAYAIPKHRHLCEIEQELTVAASENVVVNFTPHLIPVNRGILTTIYTSLAPGIQPHEVSAALAEVYKNEAFVRLRGIDLYADTKNVTYTNFIDIAWRHDPRTGRMILLSAIDNLTKGAAGQAIQCLNLMCGFPEELAL